MNSYNLLGKRLAISIKTEHTQIRVPGWLYQLKLNIYILCDPNSTFRYVSKRNENLFPAKDTQKDSEQLYS